MTAETDMLWNEAEDTPMENLGHLELQALLLLVDEAARVADTLDKILDHFEHFENGAPSDFTKEMK